MSISKQKIKQMKAVHEAVYSLIEKYKAFQGNEDEPLDGDQVDVFVDLVKDITNENEGNK